MAFVWHRRPAFPGHQLCRVEKLYQAQKPLLEKKLAEQGMLLLYAVPWPPQGLYTKTIESAADLKGASVARLQPGHGAHCRTGRRTACHRAGGRVLAGPGHWRGRIDHDLGRHRVDSKLYEHLGHYYDLQAWLPKNAVVVNRKAFDGLNKGSQEALLKAGMDAEARLGRSRKGERRHAGQAQGQRHAGAAPSPQLKADLAKVGTPCSRNGWKKPVPKARPLVDAYRK